MQPSFATMAGHAVIGLGALLRDYQLGLVLLVGGSEDGEQRPVQWVHSSDLEDPSPFLTPRTVLLTTGVQFGQNLGRDRAEAYVSRLVEVGTTALGVSVGIRWDRIPPSLIDACERLHLPLIRVPYDTPFIAVVRAAARMLEAQSRTADIRGRSRSTSLSTSIASRREDLEAGEQALRSAALTLLLAGRRELAERIAEPLLPRLPRGQLAVVSFDGPLRAQAVADLAPLTAVREGVFSAQQGQRITVIAEQRELAGLRRVLAHHEVAAGISERAGMSDLTELVEQAERAAELARLQPKLAPLVYRPEMHAGVLQLLQSSPEAMRRAQGLVAPLKQHDERHGDELLRSLAVWLAHHGQTSPAAAHLGVHRHTLRTRVNTAASLLQRDLDQPDTRAELWAALRLGGDT